jgi:hypothetical protein
MGRRLAFVLLVVLSLVSIALPAGAVRRPVRSELQEVAR